MMTGFRMKDIDTKTVSDFRSWFISYSGLFRFEEQEKQQNIDLKREHTFRVVMEILKIGNAIGLGPNDLRIAEVIALLHDVGRFEQFKRYSTFFDGRSVDHALLGIKILEDNNILSKLNSDVQELVISAIRYHNHPVLPEISNPDQQMFARLIRDADKLDILGLVTNYYNCNNCNGNGTLVLDLPDTEGISEKVRMSLINKQIVNVGHVKNINDFKLLQAGWVFDINFKPTLEFIKEQKYIEKIKDVLPETDVTSEIFDIIYSHLYTS